MVLWLILSLPIILANPPDPRYMQKSGDSMEGILGLNMQPLRLVGNPIYPSDGVNKAYVDGLCTTDNHGLVPPLTINKTRGYRVFSSASGALNIFNAKSNETWQGRNPGPNHVTIRTPHQVAIWKIAVAGNSKNWNLQGSNNSRAYFLPTYKSAEQKNITTALTEYEVASTLRFYNHYRLSMTDTNPSLKRFQIFACHSLKRIAQYAAQGYDL